MVYWEVKHKLKKKNAKDRQAEIINTILLNRGIKSDNDKSHFINPPDVLKLDLKDTNIEPAEVKKALNRLIRAVKSNESIVIYGDYDADGLCATAILWETIHQYYPKIMPYLPGRLEEGYGLSVKGIDAVKKEFNADLIITVDNGVTAGEATEYANKIGIDVIITDHHQLPKILPQAEAIIHSTAISGAGVAWFFAREFLKELPKIGFITKTTKEDLKEKLAICAIGTISDILPVVGINRSIIKEGIQQLRKTRRAGLQALFKEAGIRTTEIDSYHISFIIGPRLNATGRIAHALDALRLLCTNSLLKGQVLARTLCSVNSERQKITQEMLIHAKEKVLLTYKADETRLLFIHDKNYNQGVIGLVAGKLAEEFYLPAVVLSVGEKYAKASARSIAGFDIIEAIRSSSDLLVDCGGHPMAAGFTIETANLEKIKIKLEEIIYRKITREMLFKKIKIDLEIGFSDINRTLFMEIEKFKPFGIGNSEPVFTTSNLTIEEARLVGRDRKHLKIKVRNNEGLIYNAIAFGRDDLYAQLTKDSYVKIAYTLTQSSWNQGEIELKIKDMIIN